MITYRIDDKVYINLTNRCSNRCDFCVRINDSYKDYDLWLEKEPTVDEVIAELGEIENAKEVVFCGYGEPLYRLDAILPICDYVHSKGKKTRINTNGQASFIVGSGAAEQLHGKMDTVSISLNATDATKYQAICHSEFGEDAFSSLLQFAKECKRYVPCVKFSIVDVIGAEEIKKAQKLADDIGIELRVRAYIP